VTAILDTPTSTIPTEKPPVLVPKTPGILRVVIYARISKVGHSNSTNTTIQVEECQRELRYLAKDRNTKVVIAAVFQEDDRSASKYSKKPRPKWERTVELVQGNWVDMVIATEMERLTRRPNEMSVLIDHADPNQEGGPGDLREINLTSDDVFDLTTDNGIYRARQAVALAERESNKLSKRTRRKQAELAREGFSHGSRRAYAFKKGNGELDEDSREYEGLRHAGRLRIKGFSTKEIAFWLNEHSYRTTEGRLFNSLTIRNMLRRVRYAPWPDDSEHAIREHKGDHYKAQWKPIWTPEEWEQLQLIDKLGREKNKDRPPAKKYLLTGWLYCGGCGMRLNGETKRDRPEKPLRPVYHCRVQGDTQRKHGCGGVTIGAVPLEDFVLSCLFYRLDTPDLAKLLDTQPETGDRLKKLLDDRSFLELRIKDILKDYGRGDMTREEMLFSKSEARAKLDGINQEIDQVSRSHHASALVPVDKTIKEAWFTTDSLQWKRGVLDLFIKKIIIQPGGGKPFYDCRLHEGRFKFDPGRVEIRWKV
jgi:site-specific DNA recombinase